MGGFFRGWRRKVGCITLLLALASMGAWVRSQSCVDTLVFPTAKAMNYWMSDKYGLVWYTTGQSEEEMKGFEDPFLIFIGGPSDLNLRDWKPKSSFCGFRFFDRQIQDSRHTLSIMPYWYIVIPLTVFSTCLLLKKPKTSTQKKITEPIQNEGGA